MGTFLSQEVCNGESKPVTKPIACKIGLAIWPLLAVLILTCRPDLRIVRPL